ncbi:MAG: hypothetical protein AAFV69_08245 [Pseudomonadota bacterium]
MEEVKQECLALLDAAIDRIVGLLVSIFWLTAALFVCLVTLNMPSASAAETFVCADGTTVTVQSNQLEWMKRTNACVAQYYGLKVQDRSKTPRAGYVVADGVPLPVRRPASFDAALQGQQALRSTRDLVTGSIGAAGDAPETGTYRRVLILNAQPGKSRWYNHTQ